jgi:hypothetical protein
MDLMVKYNVRHVPVASFLRVQGRGMLLLMRTDGCWLLVWDL